MIKDIILFFLVLFGLGSCSQESNVDYKLHGWWQIDGEYSNVEINTLQWNIIKSQILHIGAKEIEFLNGLQYFPTRHFGFITPYQLHGNTLLIYYEPEGRFIDFHVKINDADRVIISKGVLDISLKRHNIDYTINSLNLDEIQSVELYVEYDSLSNQDNQIDYDVEVNVRNREAEIKRKDGVRVKKQITPFETTYLLEQVNRIDLSQNKYDAEVSDAANYTIKIKTSSKDILLELGDNTNTPQFIQGLVNFLNYYYIITT